MKNVRFATPTERTPLTGQVLTDVTPQEVYDFLNNLDENDIVERRKYDFSI